VSSVGVVILAAGASTRMGTPKQLLQYQGRSFLHHVTDIAVNSKCDPIVVILGACADQIRPEVASFPVHIVVNPHWPRGMGSSLRVGIATLQGRSPDLEAAIVLLCDQPFISIQLIHQLIEVYYATSVPIVASSYAGTLGVPALFQCCLFPALLTLKADQGAKYLMKKYAVQTAYVPFSQGAIDIDTPEDYKQLSCL